MGGALLQPNDKGELQPVAFTSCECLAICHAFDKFDHWVYGKANVTVHTDHQPLETVFKKHLSKAPQRLQRMMMCLQRHTFAVVYKAGKSLWIADTLSRAPLPDTKDLDLTSHNVFRLVLEVEPHKPSQGYHMAHIA